MSPKFVNLVYSISCIVVIAGALLKIMHLPYGNSVTLLGLIIGTAASYFYVANLKNRIKQLEQELASRNNP